MKRRLLRAAIAFDHAGVLALAGVVAACGAVIVAVAGPHGPVVPLALGLAGAALLGWAAASVQRRLVRPLSDLARRAEGLAYGGREALEPLASPGVAEIDAISRALASTASALSEREAYITDFAAQVSHEFRTPLTSIRGSAELVREHAETMTPPERERFLRNIEADADRLVRLVGRLLELARADVSRPVAVSTDLRGLLDALVQHHRAKGLEVSVTLEPSAGPVRMSEETLRSVLDNLLDNAARHGGAGVAVRVTAEAHARGGVPGVLVGVTDDGPGISPANLARVFQPFFTTARDAGGTGLGLSIARTLVAAHGGTLDLASRPGETTFSAWVPTAA